MLVLKNILSFDSLFQESLQCVQNSLVRIVTNTTKYSHITAVRRSLHWLPIKYCSVFRMAILLYEFLHSGYAKIL